MIQDAIPAAMLVVTQIPTFSWSRNGGVMRDHMPVVVGDLVLDSVWPMEHLLRCLSRAGVLIECHQLLGKDLPDPYRCLAITSLQKFLKQFAQEGVGRVPN